MPRPGLRRLLLILPLLCLMLQTPLQALEPISNIDEIQLPADLSRLDFYLITVDVGDHVWDNFGHTALRMVDTNANTDTVFNWGGFDTSAGLLVFGFNFFKGIMNYQLGTATPRAEFAGYEREQRTVWQDHINLNNAQKAILYRRLVWNMRPENIVYPYQYYDDNCTTRVRDYLDEAMGGEIHAASLQPTENSYRDITLYHYRSLGVIALSLDILMNSNIDHEPNAWEEMFLPLSLRARLMEIPSDVAGAGGRRMLLSDTEVPVAFASPAAQPNPYYVAASIMLVPALLLLMLLHKIPMTYLATQSRYSLRLPGLSFRLLGLLGITVALCSGLYGTMMLGGWFFSGHEDLYHNWNLLLFWPTDFIGVIIAARWLLQAKPWPMTHNTAPSINYYLFFKMLGLFIYAVVAGFGLATQSLWSLLVFLVPGLFALTLLLWLVGFEPARPKHMFF